MSKVHELKITTNNFNMVISGGMTFQIRRYDRDFKEGDILYLKEYSDGVLTGRTQPCKVNLILTVSDGLQDGYVLLNIKLVSIHVTTGGERYVTNT